jgi:peptidoglycan/xylan/chitin deacetylase (PgdA/CDA1 family)
MARLLFTVDAEEFDLPQEYGLAHNEADALSISRRGFEALQDLLRQHRVQATHFTTLPFAEAASGPLREALVLDHELGLHAYAHRDDLRKLSAAEASHRLATAKRRLEAEFSVTVRGYRANRFRSPARSVLRDVGLQWTSNLHPTWVPGSYNNFTRTRLPHVDAGLLEVPISVTPTLRLPLSWFWLRNFGWPWFRANVRRAMQGTGYLHIYVHPWEFATHAPIAGLPLMGRLSLRRTGPPFLHLMDRVLRWCADEGLQPMTITRYLREQGHAFPEGCACC